MDHQHRGDATRGRPIADYALISDCRSAALVSRDGSIDWLCPGRFDRPSVFARLLDEQAGHWALRPAGEAKVSRRYLEGTRVLETTIRTATGTLVLQDAMAHVCRYTSPVGGANPVANSFAERWHCPGPW